MTPKSRSALPLLALLGFVSAAPALVAQSALTDTAPGTVGGQSAAPEQQNPQPGQAETVSDGQTNQPASDIIRSLAPFESGNPGAPRVVQLPKGRVRIDASRSIDLTVFFVYDSAQLLPEARPQLDALAAALRSPQLRNSSYLVAGHTDAKGSDAYNLDQSLRRALSVRDYLVRVHGISPDRLIAHGWGERQLRLPSDPHSGVNRRVEIALLLPRKTSLLRTEKTPFGHRMSAVEHRFIEPPLHPLYPTHLRDPRYRLASDALDDFHALPTKPAL